MRGSRRTTSATSDRADHGLRRPLDARHRPGRRHHPREGPAQGRPLRGAEGDVAHELGHARDALSHQGHQLLDLVGLLDLGALHRQRRGDDPDGASRTSCLPAAARNSTGRSRFFSTPWARCHQILMNAAKGKPRLRRQPRRLRYRRRSRRAGARGAGTGQGARRQIYGELAGYGATSDGFDMVRPPAKARPAA